MKFKQIFQVPTKTWPFQQADTFDFFELLHLKMEVPVSEPCNVIRVENVLGLHIVADLEKIRAVMLTVGYMPLQYTPPSKNMDPPHALYILQLQIAYNQI